MDEIDRAMLRKYHAARVQTFVKMVGTSEDPYPVGAVVYETPNATRLVVVKDEKGTPLVYQLHDRNLLE